MSKKIHLLPDHVANRIAAGEVVQRPASVVKEILENALDAKATTITLAICDGGKTHIQIIDNGCGMDEIDARMCFERHATSKISNVNDLVKVNTYGFRGEAMSSIAAVSEVELITRMLGEKLGTRVVVEESTVQKQESVAAPVGTQINVRYLFRKVPGRRNFLKSNAVEAKHVIDEFQRVALAHPEVIFFLHQNGKEVYHLPATKLSNRIIHLFGDRYRKKLIESEEKTTTLKLHGYIAPPSEARKTRGEQFFFVNNRYIRSGYLHHAVKTAFEQLLPPDRIPLYFIFITIPPAEVDINVHPTKVEVKFQNERLVYSLIASSVRKALATHHCMHTIDFTGSSTSALFPLPGSPTASSFPAAPAMPPIGERMEQEAQTVQASFVQHGEDKEYVSSVSKEDEHILEGCPTMKLQLHKKYILAQVKSGLLVIDQKAAYERILYERNKHLLVKQSTNAQKLLFPHVIRLQPGDLALLQGCREDLYALGFQFDITPNSEVKIIGQPQNIGKYTIPEELVTGLLVEYKRYMTNETISQQENWARSLAKRSTFPTYHVLSLEEMNSIVDQLFACENPNYTADGMPIWRIITIDYLQELL